MLYCSTKNWFNCIYNFAICERSW